MSARRDTSPPAVCYPSVDTFAAAVGIGRTTAYAEIAAGRLRVAKVGRRTIVPIREAELWLTARTAGATDPQDAA